MFDDILGPAKPWEEPETVEVDEMYGQQHADPQKNPWRDATPRQQVNKIRGMSPTQRKIWNTGNASGSSESQGKVWHT